MLAHFPYFDGPVCVRRLRADDLPAFHAYRSDADVARFQGWSPMTLAQAALFLHEQEQVQQHAPGSWVQIGIATASDDRLVGDIGLWLAPDLELAEFGISMDAAFQGKGLASAALRALFALLFHTGVARIIATADARNAACIKMLERAGMNRAQTMSSEFKGAPCTEHVYALVRAQADAPAPDFAGQRA